jgi:photosystem II stability/assembly factor-like uncharacterized protein
MLGRVAVPSESVAPADASIRWRVVAPTSVERSTDGGQTWTKTIPPPGLASGTTPAVTVVGVRAVDALRAVIRTSDGRELYTTNGGQAWTRVQEKSAAPF